MLTKRWMGGDSDEIRRRFISFNFQWFRYSPTFWLPIGRLFWITEPMAPLWSVLAFDNEAVAFPDSGHSIFIGLPPDVE